MPNGPTGAVRFPVEEFATLLRALPADAEVGKSVRRTDPPYLDAVTAGEMLHVLLAVQRRHVYIQEQYGSHYIVMLDGRFDASEGTERLWVGVFEGSPLFGIIRDRHHSSSDPSLA
jgi:hypothetical protein